MASFVTQNLGKQVFGDIQKEWSDAVGFGADTPSRPEPAINWTNLNYPPFFRLFHYDPSELPTAASRVVRPMHWNFLIALVILIINVVDNIVLVTGGVTFFRVVFSCLNFLIFVPIFGFIFYEGYKAVATSDTKAIKWYLVYEAIQIVICVAFVALPFGGINGLAVLKYRNDEIHKDVKDSIKNFWLICAIYESALWFGIGLLSGFNLFRAKTFNPYHSQEARASN